MEVAAPTNSESVYIIQTPMSLVLQENVYKPGRTARPIEKRLAEYSKGSRLLFVMPCPNSKDVEDIIVKRFTLLFKHRSDLGREHFEGPLSEMVSEMIDIVKVSNSPADLIQKAQIQALQQARLEKMRSQAVQPIALTRKPVKCDRCMRPFSRQEHLDLHLLKKTKCTPFDPQQKKYKCVRCDRAYSCASGLSVHKHKCTGVRKNTEVVRMVESQASSRG